MDRRRAGAPAFGPRWLEAQLVRLLPAYPDVRLAVAFSGGADSTALLAAASRLRRPALKLRALHIDHGLHPDSARWARHCRRVARALGVTLRVRRARVRPAPGESPEAAAREARYRLLGDALAAGEVLLCAHTQDDQLETVLLQLLRGSGPAGLAAMPGSARLGRGVLVRPLLALPRAPLEQWLRATGQRWLEDPDNAERRRDRNYLRHEVLPAIRARWPAAGFTVARAAAHAAEAHGLIAELGAADAGRASCGAALSVPVLRRLPPARRRNALRAWIAAAGVRAPPAARLEVIAAPLLAARHDAHPLVAWDGAQVRRHGELLHLQAASAATGRVSRRAAAREPPIRWRWGSGARAAVRGAFGTLRLEPDAHGPIDLAALPAVLGVQVRRGGERLRPVPGGPHRPLKSLLQEARMPPERRLIVPLVYAGRRLVAAGDQWLDASVRAGPGARRRGRFAWRAPA